MDIEKNPNKNPNKTCMGVCAFKYNRAKPTLPARSIDVIKWLNNIELHTFKTKNIPHKPPIPIIWALIFHDKDITPANNIEITAPKIKIFTTTGALKSLKSPLKK